MFQIFLEIPFTYMRVSAKSGLLAHSLRHTNTHARLCSSRCHLHPFVPEKSCQFYGFGVTFKLFAHGFEAFRGRIGRLKYDP